MSIIPKVNSIYPKFAIPGGEISINCEGFTVDHYRGFSVIIGGRRAEISSASSTHILVRVPEGIERSETELILSSGGVQSAPVRFIVGRLIVSDMHIVANPAVDPDDDSIIVTRSGGRGQQLDATLFRVRGDGDVEEMADAILNPTGVAFGRDGTLYVTARAEGEVYSIDRRGRSSLHATGLGVATGIAFDPQDQMYVGDRTGTIYRVDSFFNVTVFASLEPSIAAYHLAFGPSDHLFVTSPGLASHDRIFDIDKDGSKTAFGMGFGRPQGLAFDTEGRLYAAACYQGRHGIVRISADRGSVSHFVAGNNVIGLCFSRNGEMLVATGDSLYSVPCGLQGTLLS